MPFAALLVAALAIGGAIAYARFNPGGRVDQLVSSATDAASSALTTVSTDARELIKKLEGFAPGVYNDVGHAATGYGHDLTGKETTTDPEQLLTGDINAAEKAIATYVKVPLSDNQRAALTSFVYNVGAGHFASSTLLAKLNAGDYAGAANEFDKWIYAAGEKSPALIQRRAEEKSIFLTA